MKYRFHLRLILSALAALFILNASNAQLGGLMKKKKTDPKNESVEMREEMGEYNGVKHAIRVVGFENDIGWRGQWDLGNNLADMLESALFDTQRFVLVEREELGNVIMEQDLQASGRAAESSSVAQTGLIRSARYIATGSITRVDHQTGGDSGGIAIKGLRLGGGSNKAEIELVVKLVDSTSGEVVASERISGTAGGRKLRVGFYKNGVSGNMEGFAKSSLGEAAQDCISQAAEFIAREMEDFDITANIVMASSDTRIVINRGENYGVNPGAVFAVREMGEVLTDPETGEILDVFEGQVTSRIEVTRASEKVAYCKLIEGSLPNRGDSVVLE
ncbi:CsgG/HfaB family protein [Pelagicoccus sp. SDUM812002]|uniref:CsgG/HfaB family protein n=1 Tax=Pelagicoccus sp. SDUM812002 TaxID=3041266 RepID=UPI00280CB4A3|nr:CsgG/HfaB family protein [Pelagicoccus sp. SDUM812002]MDQ8186724.1 CsgG/HfaB family protein [Pelagicoccus sp. SDUM812002]